MKVSKEQLNQIIKEELAGVLEEAKETPEWSSDYYRGVGRSRGGRGKSAHGYREDPFTSPIRYAKGKLGMPRDKIEKFKKKYRITTGEAISDAALSYALYKSPFGERVFDSRPSLEMHKKTNKAIQKDMRRVMDALERLSRNGEVQVQSSGRRVTVIPWEDKKQYLDTINKIIAGERR